MKNFYRSERYKLFSTSTPQTILVHGVRFIITINEADGLDCIENSSIVIENGIITDIYPKKKLVNEARRYDLIYDAEPKGGVVVTPGFINMHAHPPMYLLRSTLTFEENNLEKALAGMAKIEGKMSEENFYLGALGDFTEEQKSGITTTLSHYGTFDGIEKAAKESGHHVINCLSAVSNSHPTNTPELVESYLKRTDTFTTPGIALHYVWKASPEVLKKIGRLIATYKPPFTLHVAESKETVAKCYDAYGKSPVAVLAEYGLLTPRTILSHVVHVSDEDIEIIKKSGAIVAHLPTSNQLHRSGYFNYKKFVEHKANHRITLGTDSVVSKNRLDLLTEAFTMKTIHQANEIVTYEDLFNMMTAQPARLLGLKKLGKVVPGYTANLAFWKLKDRGLMPYNEDNPTTLVSNLITHGGRNARDVMIDGQFVISNRYHNLVNESKLMENLQQAHMELRNRP